MVTLRGISTKELDVILNPSEGESLIKQAGVGYTFSDNFFASKEAERAKLYLSQSLF
jgi:hypothetical protein